MAIVLAGVLAAGPAMARGHGPARPPVDLTGVWSNASLTSLERPDDFRSLTITEAEAQAYEKTHRGKPPEDDPAYKDDVGGIQSEWWETDVGLARIRGQARTSWIVSPADGQRPFTAAAKAANKARRARMKTDLDGPESRTPDERCLGIGASPPLDNGGLNDNYQIVQAGDRLAIHGEWMHDVRTVVIDPAAKHPPPGLRIMGGDSIAHWDGDTLVIETTNFTPLEVRAPDGDPKADMKVVERLTRLSPTEILYAFSVTSPARYTQTWQGEMLLHPASGPIYEYACHEGNYGLANMLAAARRLEGKTIDGVAAGR